MQEKKHEGNGWHESGLYEKEKISLNLVLVAVFWINPDCVASELVAKD